MGRIVEISGIKLELDERTGTLKNVDCYRVGDNVKLLKKEYESYKSVPAVIVEFDAFEKMPTIVVAYLATDYSGAQIHFAYINSATKDMEICPMSEMEMVINKNLVIDALNRAVQRKEDELIEMKMKRAYFLEQFGKYFAGGEGKSEMVGSGIHA